MKRTLFIFIFALSLATTVRGESQYDAVLREEMGGKTEEEYLADLKKQDYCGNYTECMAKVFKQDTYEKSTYFTMLAIAYKLDENTKLLQAKKE